MTLSIRILHIADLHFDHKANASIVEKRKQWMHYFQDLCASQPFDLIVASGDVGNQGDAQSLEKGFAYLTQVALGTRGPQAKPHTAHAPFIVVPGNHDVQWPPSLTEASEWTHEQRFKSFMKHCPPTFIRPPLTESETKLHRTNPPGLTQQPFGGLPDALWYLLPGSDQRPPVLVLPLSSVTLSGTLILSKGAEEAFNRLTSDPQVRPHLDAIRKLFVHDLPYVDTTSIDVLRKELTTWPQETQDIFRRAVKIAVVHHPLVPIPGEQEARPFDTPVNGSNVRHDLSRLGFHIVLYGHRHIMGIRHHFGMSSHAYSDAAQEPMTELVSLAGGHLRTDFADNHGVHILEVECEPPNVAKFRLRVKRVDFHGTSEQRPSNDLLTVHNNGHTRWVHARYGGTGNAYLARAHPILLNYCEAVQKIEQAYQAEPSSEADRYLDVRLRELVEYATGRTRGVSDDFLKEIHLTAQSASAMLFVDYEGYGTWGQPDLLALAAELFRAFCLRNANLLNIKPTQEFPNTSWCHCPVVNAIQERICSPTTLGGCARASLSDPNQKQLPFDMARILVWTDETVDAPSTRALVRLHEVFGVPLARVNPKDLGLGFTGLVDFHAEWQPKEGSYPTLNDMPDRIVSFSSATRRRIVANRHEKQKLWATVGELIEHVQAPPKGADRLGVSEQE